MSLLEIKNLNLTYPNGKKIFENAEISLQAGESQALWSPNGTGKTSLFRVITGLLKPQAADIYLEDKAVSDEAGFKALRLKVGFVLQHADDQLFFPQVIDDVAFGPLNQGLSEEEARKVSEEALSTLGILELKDALSYELSGGQKKLVTLACVLSMKPQVLLLDEPTNGLDIDSKQRLIEEINKIDAAKIIISHDPASADSAQDWNYEKNRHRSSTCTKFATIRNCRIESIAKPEMHEHWHTHFYGGVPHTHQDSA